MGECPNPECHERVRESWERIDRLEKILAEMRLCMEKKIPKKWLWIFIVTIGISLGSTSAKVWLKSETNELRFAGVEEVKEHETRLRLLENNFKVIKDTLKEIKEDQKDIKRTLRELMLRRGHEQGSND